MPWPWLPFMCVYLEVPSWKKTTILLTTKKHNFFYLLLMQHARLNEIAITNFDPTILRPAFTRLVKWLLTWTMQEKN